MNAISHVTPAYAHHAKRAVPQGLLRAGATQLKFYHLEKPGEPVSDAIGHAARAFLTDEGGERAGLNGDLGFALLHRCGADFHFLLVTVWRGANEAWEAVWYREGGMTGFAPFGPAYPEAAGKVRPTFCVWELGIVAHEAASWARLLDSPRETADVDRWRSDWLAGQV